jgi:hydrogenase small subunit
MSKMPKTVYEEIREQGYSRRDFLKFCGAMAAMLGLETSGMSQVARALETKTRIPVLWMHFQDCTGCSESFIRSSHPLIADIILDKVSLDYTETLMAAAGHQAEKSFHDTMEKHYGEYLLMVEGSVPTKNPGYCTIGGKSVLDRLQIAAAGAKAVIAWGNCASSGGIGGASPNPTGAKPVHKLIHGKPVINVQGCPPISEVMTGVVVHILTFDRIPQLDALKRPKAFYSNRVHDTCYRRPHYDAGLFVESFDDENARKGYCLYKMGCKGPNTYNACGVMRWNNGVSFPIQSGHPCIGCSEANFWDNDPFYSHLPGFKGFGIEKTADRIGLGLGIVTAAGIGMHMFSTNLRKRREIMLGEAEDKSENFKNNP